MADINAVGTSARLQDEVRKLVVKELGLEGMNQDRQHATIKLVSDALVERASLAIMSRLPVETLERINNLPLSEQADAFVQESLTSNQEDMKLIIRNSLREGLIKYHEFLDEAISKKTESNIAA